MPGRYRAYPKYKDSGIKLLDDIPSHWDVMQLKRSVDGCVNGIWGSEPEGDENDTIVLRVADFDRSKLSIKNEGYTYRKIEPKEKINRALKRGDLLLEKSGGGEKTLVGQVVLFNRDFEAVTSNFVAKMSPNDGFDSRYLNYVFSRFYDDKINYCSIKQNTGIQNLDSELYLSEKFGFPTNAEQLKIANFLDHETAKIDTLIEKQQQLIKLLKEKRQAVISHVVTKGLNPNAKMRDSGVEWLGEVPEHWSMKIKLVSVAESSRGSFVNGPFGSDLLSLELQDVGVPVIYIRDLKHTGYMRKSAVCVTEEKARQLEICKVVSGDVLIAKVGDPPGEACIYPENEPAAIITQDVIRIRVNRGVINPYYLVMLLNSDL